MDRGPSLQSLSNQGGEARISVLRRHDAATAQRLVRQREEKHKESGLRELEEKALWILCDSLWNTASRYGLM